MTTQFCQKPLKDVKTLYQDDFNSIENANVSKSELANWPKRNNPHPLEVRIDLLNISSFA